MHLFDYKQTHQNSLNNSYSKRKCIKYSMLKTQRRIISIVVPLLIFLFLLSPEKYAESFWNGLCIWALNVLPVLLPFGFISTIWTTSIASSKRSFTGLLFKINCDKIFISSIICGYPVGAQQISENCSNSNLAEKMFSFCSTSSPIFILGTVGAKFLQSTTAGIIIAISQLFSCILNGILYNNIYHTKNINTLERDSYNNKPNNIFDTLLNCILSVLSVGAIIALFIMLGDIIKSVFPRSISSTCFFNFLLGLLETTSGIISISKCTSLFSATILSSTLLAFGGVSVLLQSLAFLHKLNVNVLRLVIMKITQAAIATITSFLLCVFFLSN